MECIFVIIVIIQWMKLFNFLNFVVWFSYHLGSFEEGIGHYNIRKVMLDPKIEDGF